MAIEFKKETFATKLLDASQGFQEIVQRAEVRFDPLTGRQAALFDSPLRKYKIAKTDLSDLVQRSVEMGCPFCPANLEKVTPKYPPELFPEGRFSWEEICILPNNASFAPYSAVAVMGRQHFVPVADYPQELLVHGFQACQLFLKRVAQYDRRISYCTINWNCFPPAGGSIIHPHLQPIADYLPVNHLKTLLLASRRYYRKNGSAYWPDLVAREKALGERYLGNSGPISWLVNYSPWSRWWDVLAVFPGPVTLPHFSAEDWQNFVAGLRRVLKFISDQNFYSFNLTLFSPINQVGYFWPHAHITPRYVLPPVGMSDASYIELFHGQSVTAYPPEQICRELKVYFDS